MDYDAAFLTAINHAMLYEVGPFWDPTDADVIAGNCSTPQQARKVGYTNTPGDRGGVTKYGISLNENPSVDVANLNLDSAMQFYLSAYWTATKCDQIPGPVAVIHLDGAINNGPGRAAKFLQQAAGVTPDGQIGPATIAAVNAMDVATLINQISSIRSAFYSAIVQHDPSQAEFLAGWLRRINEVTTFSLAQIQS